MSARTRPVSRRSLLTDFGAAGIGLIVLGACGGSSTSTSSTSTSSSASSSSSPGADAPVDSSAAGSDADATGDTPPEPGSRPESDALQLQHVSLGFVSAYVLVRGSEAAIVDTGQSDSREAIFDALAALSVRPSDVRDVVLTHNHGDHIGGLSEIEGDVANATVHAGAADIGSVRTALPLVEANDGDEVFGMGVIATPGHTPGSISVFDTDSGILVAGDALNGDGSGGLTGANPDFSSDVAAAAISVETLAALMPMTVAFGHGGPPVTDDAAAKLSALTAS